MDLYGSSLVVAEAVSREIRFKANIPDARRKPENRVMCVSAEQVVALLDSGAIRVCELPPAPGTMDKLDRVLRQLREVDADQAKGVATSQVDSAWKHAGEAESIVSAARTIEHGRTAILLTNDGGASRVAQRHGVPSRHVGNLLAELGCADRTLGATKLYDQFTQVTAKFASVPIDARPADSAFFECEMTDATCCRCDSANPG
ncbi:hypothetical protein OG905_11305 [Streptomyces sp. NBC_00322]|uniref:hypothetical protein n=1 Tax=Streptomyces sp. NBC_00322 TaxID=2975712 RepID=UPI002E2E0A6D|nr:hypothetical protein [Streptomyces sp. NBC_00322]